MYYVVRIVGCYFYQTSDFFWIDYSLGLSAAFTISIILLLCAQIVHGKFQFTHGNFKLLTAISIFSRQHSRHFSLRSPPVNFGGRQWPPKVKTQNQKSIFNVDLQNEKWKSKSKSRFTNIYASRQWVDNRTVYWSRKIVSFIPGGEGHL